MDDSEPEPAPSASTKGGSATAAGACDFIMDGGAASYRADGPNMLGPFPLIGRLGASSVTTGERDAPERCECASLLVTAPKRTRARRVRRPNFVAGLRLPNCHARLILATLLHAHRLGCRLSRRARFGVLAESVAERRPHAISQHCVSAAALFWPPSWSSGSRDAALRASSG